jgi:hypothetical protein
MALDINTKTRVFLDRKAVADAVGKANAVALGKAGMLLRRTARQSMRRRKKAAPPGQPPSAHSGKDFPRGPLLKKFLFAEFDLVTKSIVVGPTALPGSKSDVHRLLETGSVKRIQLRPPKKVGRQASPLQSAAFKRKIKDGSLKRVRPTITATVQIPARPYMRPALAKDAPQFPSLFANTVTP